jgi:hypothetical protein
VLKRSKCINRLITALGGLSIGSASLAADIPDWELNGFLTQGYFYSSDNNMYGQSEQGSWDFRELALNGVWNPTRDLVFAGQVMSRRAGEVQDGDPRIDYALIDYRVSDAPEGRFGLRLGRIKNPFGFYNETRDVAFTRPSIMLPQAVYFDIARDLELSSDGVEVYGSRSFDAGWLDTELLFGKPNRGTSVEYAYLSADWPGSFDDSKGFMWRAVYNSNDQRWRLGATMGRFRLDFDANESALVLLPPPLQAAAPRDGHIDIDAYLLSLQYNLERWSFTTEISRQKTEWGTLQGIFGVDPVNRYEAGYVQAEYRFSSDWSAVARYEELYFDIDDRDGKKAEARLGKPAHTQYAKDFTLGVAWQPAAHWMLRAEWHSVRGTAWLPEQDNPDASRLSKEWDLYALQATYRF